MAFVLVRPLRILVLSLMSSPVPPMLSRPAIFRFVTVPTYLATGINASLPVTDLLQQGYVLIDCCVHVLVTMENSVMMAPSNAKKLERSGKSLLNVCSYIPSGEF